MVMIDPHHEHDDMPTPTEFDRGTAYHEAAHIIVAITLGFRVESVTLTPGGATSMIERPEQCDTKPSLLAAAAYYLAGGFGETREVGSPDGVHGDYQNAIDMVTPMVVVSEEATAEEVKAEVFRQLDRASILCRSIMDYRWDDIRHLAGRLMKSPSGLSEADLTCYVARRGVYE